MPICEYSRICKFALNSYISVIIMIIQKYIIGGVIGVAVLSTFLLSSGAVNPSWNPFNQAPSDSSFEKAFANLGGVAKMRIKGLVEADIKNLPEELKQQTEESAGISFNTLNGSVSFDQQIDNSNQLEKKRATELMVSVGIEGVAMSLGISAIGINKDLYLMVNNLPPFLPASISASDIKGKWFKADLKSLMAGTEAATQLNSGSNNPEETVFLNELKNIASGDKFFKVKKSLGQETVDGALTQHYVIEIDKASVKEALPKVFNLATQYTSQNASQEYQDNLQNSISQIMDNFDLIWAKIDGITFDAWIETGENRLKKIKFEKTISDNTLRAEFLFSDFGKDFQIKAPDTFFNIEDIIPKSWLTPPATASQ